MSEFNEQLSKIAASIDALIEKLAAEESKEEKVETKQVKVATETSSKSGGFGTISNYSEKNSDPLLSWILS